MKLNNKVVLILAGVGSVGSEVLNILIKQTSNFSLIGILNSKNMIYNKEGIYNKDALNQLIKKGTKSNLNMLLERATIYKNKIFIDCSSSKQLIKQYQKLLILDFQLLLQIN